MLHLLVLDDDRGMTALLSMVARDFGWTADVAVSEAEFQERFRARRPDVIMMDLQLGSSDGIEQLRFLGREKYSGNIVLISGFDARVLTSAQEVGQGMGLTIVATMPKPIRVATLRELLKKLEQWKTLPLSQLAGQQNNPAASEKPFTPADVRRALDAGEMELYLQPILSIAGRSISQLEGLIRWKHPKRGLVPPAMFIPVAESDPATIDALTFWTIRTAARQSGDLTLEGYETVIAVNISGVSLRALDFPDRVEDAIRESGAPLDGISFEVTETTALQNPAEVADILTRLRLKGFDLALDDFGAGYSSLKTLRQMPFSALKIDGSFVSDMMVSAESLAIVKSVIQLAQSLGVESIAEGVETKDIADQVMALGASGFQGYYLSPPLPIHEMAAWLKGWNLKARAGKGDPGGA